MTEPMVIRPISRNAAGAYLARVHRHQPSLTAGWLFGCGLYRGDQLLGVACAGRPCRSLQDGLTCEISRVATEGERDACSRLYGALCRAAKALGYSRIVTYTRMDERGSACLAAGFRDDGPAGGGEWGRPSRPRNAAADPSPKRRWIWTLDK